MIKWIVIGILFAIAEGLTLTLTMIWFTIGAIAAIVTSFFTDSLFIQLIVFAVVSFTLLYLATKKIINLQRDSKNENWGSVETNIDALIGKKGIVVKKIKSFETGIVKVRGEEWSASTDSGIEINEGEMIVVKSIQGVKLIVDKSID